MTDHMKNIKSLAAAAEYYDDPDLLDSARAYRDLLGAYRSMVWDLEEIKKGKRPDRPTGRLGLVELRKKCSELFTILDESEDEGEIHGALEAYKREIAQMMVDLPDWYRGPYDDPDRGYVARRDRALARARRFQNAG